MQTIDLAGEWNLRRESTRKVVPAIVPGDTHSALVAAGVIPDPYVGMNELDVQWIGREDWAYERELPVDPAFLAEDRVELSCDCLDAITEVFVNGNRAGASDNAFVRWRFDVKRFLKPGRNTLRILFHSAENAAVKAAASLPYPVPHSDNPVQSPHRNLVRKIQCHSGWDWGPCLMVAGIMGDISLQAFSDARIDYVLTEQRHKGGRCTVKVTAECDVQREGDYELAVRLGDQRASKRVRLSRAAGAASLDIVVENPKLWWPNGYGEQPCGEQPCGEPPLYDLVVSLGSQEVKKRIGLRTLQLINKPDKAGLSMSFRVNGVDVFCKGANWIPFDSLPQRQTAERLEHLLVSATRANMNMLRVWGGGGYESDRFYELCDRMGLLIWHDMMFSCALYPATPDFLSSVEREIRHQVKRLRDHPSIALWCGNNEDVGALTWYPESRRNRDRYLVDYDRLNEGVIGRVVDECDPTRTFWPSSPSAGRGDYSDNWHADGRGDMHYWSVWHEGKPFSAYYDVSPRFCSEFGYQSFPSIGTIRSYAAESEWNVTSPVMEHHQRNRRGNSIITEMFTRYYRVPEGFPSFVYLSQVQQAVAITTAVEYWRRLRPLCMGTLYWQLNDTWPVCSWSSLEYDGTWKLLHYAARRFFAPLLLAAEARDGRLEIWLTSDRTEEVACRATARVLDFSGKALKEQSLPARMRAGSARLLKAWDLAEIAPRPDQVFLSLTLEHDDTTDQSDTFLTEPKRCTLPAAKVTMDVAASAGGFEVRLSADAPAFYAALTAEGIAGEFSDNFFTVIPDRPRVVRFNPRARVSVDAFRRALSVMHLRDTYR